MNTTDVSKLSLRGVELLARHCEHLIRSCQADLGEYELYVRCQAELVKRQHTRQPPQLTRHLSSFIKS